MERDLHRPNGGDQQPEVNSYGTDDSAEQARIERARQEASEQRRHDREEWERYVAAGINEEDADGLVEFKRYVREQHEQVAKQQAKQHTEDSPAEREIRTGLYQARTERRTVDDATACRIAAELHGEQGSTLDKLASSGAIQRDQLLRELVAHQVEPSWRIHWIDALTQYVLEHGERGPVPGWEELAADEPEHDDAGAQPDAAKASQPERDVGPERLSQLAPRIYVACLASYNQGILHGLWIDANQDVDELQADIEAMLAASPTVGAEEYAIHDHEGFGGFEPGEHEDLAVISRVARGIVHQGEAFAVYLAWAGSSEEAVERFHHHYVGTFASPKDWARQICDELGWEQQLEQRLDDELLPYVSIDYQACARDLANRWHVVEGDKGTHVFGP